ncbi:hypothetical protein [Duganella vulcania]|uniref:Uncharacterized protein n=1 Tax=Duganella vulcania TaxID=2692166 RepID=A0A845GDS9_9BURK|nr:hypothetical protein [Duganella vulcania]MYM92434.1 hypothetical protein [Duganella vulcania]
MTKRAPLVEGIDYGLDVSADGTTVWVHGADGSNIGRFSKRFGIDVHRTLTAQMAGAGQCLHCTHAPAGPAQWEEFRTQMKAHHHVDVPADVVSWP